MTIPNRLFASQGSNFAGGGIETIRLGRDKVQLQLAPDLILISFQLMFKSAFPAAQIDLHMVPVTGYDIFGGDSDLSDVHLNDEQHSCTRPARNTATKKKSSSSKLSAHSTARNRSQSHGNFTLNERPTSSARPRSTHAKATSYSSSEASLASNPPASPILASPSRKRKSRPSEPPIDTTPARRHKKQKRRLFDDPVDNINKVTTPSKCATAEFRIGWTPSQSPSKQEDWNFRMLQGAKVFVKLLLTNGSPAASDTPFADTYWWPARVSTTPLFLLPPSTLP